MMDSAQAAAVANLRKWLPTDRIHLVGEHLAHVVIRVVHAAQAVHVDVRLPEPQLADRAEVGPDGKWQLAPAFDVTWAYGGPWTRTHQMRAGGKDDGFTRADLVEIGERFDVARGGSEIIDAGPAPTGAPSTPTPGWRAQRDCG